MGCQRAERRGDTTVGRLEQCLLGFKANRCNSPQTYMQWDRDFSYLHLSSSVIDEDAWGEYDPRIVMPCSDAGTYQCPDCGETQSDDTRQNECVCYANLYGSPKPNVSRVQIARIEAKNNGLLACCPFEKGWAVAEFVGQITAGVKGVDVMFDKTDRSTYQVWQGRQGNCTRFINHSCKSCQRAQGFPSSIEKTW